MKPTDQVEKKPLTKESDFLEIIKSNIEADTSFVTDTGTPARIVYYCRDCEKIVKPKRIGKKLKFGCSECGGSNISFGSEKSIKNYYRIKNITNTETKK